MSGKAQAQISSIHVADIMPSWSGALVGGTPQVIVPQGQHMQTVKPGWVVRAQKLAGNMTAVASDMSTNGCLYLQFFDLPSTANIATTTPKRSIKIPYGANPKTTYNPAGNTLPDLGPSNGVLCDPTLYSTGIVVALSTTPESYVAANSGNTLYIDSLTYAAAVAG